MDMIERFCSELREQLNSGKMNVKKFALTTKLHLDKEPEPDVDSIIHALNEKAIEIEEEKEWDFLSLWMDYVWSLVDINKLQYFLRQNNLSYSLW